MRALEHEACAILQYGRINVSSRQEKTGSDMKVPYKRIGSLVLSVLLMLPAWGRGTRCRDDSGAGIVRAVSGTDLEREWGMMRTGAEQSSLYLPLLRGKRVGVVANHTSVIGRACLSGIGDGISNKMESGQSHSASVSTVDKAVSGTEISSVTDAWQAEDTAFPSQPSCQRFRQPLPGTADNSLYVHLVDMLLDSGIRLQKVFSPEHGFRGQAEAGAKVNSQIDSKTGLPLVSLYGNHKKPTQEDLQDIDILLFDLQDVGLRFYTYISTLHYVMEACAEAGIPVIVLDRPNPHAAYTDGPVLDTACCRSFVGMHPVPVVYGMTIGEYARMIQGEHWLKNGIDCDLSVIPMEHYSRRTEYAFPVAPSPNLRSMKAIYAYPSLCFFEGTPVSLGRGTWQPFECFGFPGSPVGDYAFRPEPIKGLSENPPCKGQECRGFRIPDSIIEKLPEKICWDYLIDMYAAYPEKEKFFTAFFSKLAGTTRLADAVREGMEEDELRDSWQKELEDFEIIRQKYLLYD